MKPKLFWTTVTLILLLAALFRFYRLADHPLGITFDPAINGLDAVRLLQRGGDLPIFFPTNGGREPLHVYALIPAIWLFGTTPYAIRFVTASSSLLSVAFLFAFLYHSPAIKKATIPTSKTQTPYNFWLATLGSLTLATSYWAIVTARLGLRTELSTLLTLPIIWFFLKGWLNGPKQYFILSGLLMGLLGYTYSAARLLPFILLLALLPEFIPTFQQKKLNYKLKLTNLALFILTASIIYLPMLWYLSTHPTLLAERAASVMIWNFLDTPTDIITEMGRNILRIGGFFCCVGSPNPLFGLPEYPGSHLMLFPFLVLGLMGAIINWRDLFPRLIALWWGIGLAPSIVSIEAPHPLRMVLALVPTAILIALGPIYLLRWLSTPKTLLTPKRCLALTILIILFSMLNNASAYFKAWTKLQATQGAFDYGAIAIRDAVLREAEMGQPVYLPLSRLNFSTLLFYLSGHFQREARLFTPLSESAVVISPDKFAQDTTWVQLTNQTATLLPPLTSEGQQLIQTALASNDTYPINMSSGETIARVAHLSTDPAAFSQALMYPLKASFGPIDLIGATYPFTIDPTTNLPVTLFWQAKAAIDTEYDILLQLVDDKRRVWGNGSGRPTDWVYPTTLWQPALDNIAAQHMLTIGPEQPGPGRYWLAIAILDPTTGHRLPLSTENGNSPDTFFVGPLKVPLPNITKSEIITTPLATYGDMIQLDKFIIDQPVLQPGDTLQLSLLWHVLAKPDLDYTVFIHLLDPAGNLVAGNDSQPLGGRYPTMIWTLSEQILDQHIIPIPPDLPPGQYYMAIGFYHQPTGLRLPLQTVNNNSKDAAGRLILETIINIHTP